MSNHNSFLVAGTTADATRLLSKLVDEYPSLVFEVPRDDDVVIDSSVDIQTKCCPQRWKEFIGAIYILCANLSQVSVTLNDMNDLVIALQNFSNK